jgi:hypothetical protein
MAMVPLEAIAGANRIENRSAPCAEEAFDQLAPGDDQLMQRLVDVAVGDADPIAVIGCEERGAAQELADERRAEPSVLRTKDARSSSERFRPWPYSSKRPFSSAFSIPRSQQIETGMLNVEC